MTPEEILNYTVDKSNKISKRFEELRLREEAIDLEKIAIQKEREELRIERHILENFDERDLLSITTVTTTVRVRSGRMPNGSRMHIQDCIRQLFEIKGSGMSMKELISSLDRLYQYAWSEYAAAYNYLTKLDCLEKVARGYYQYRK